VLDPTDGEARLEKPRLLDEVHRSGDRYVAAVEHFGRDGTGLRDRLRSSLGFDRNRGRVDEAKHGHGHGDEASET
jgi:hypothetical protein